MRSRIQQLRECVKIQGYDGNWNYNQYMCGMYNGLELALSICEGREVEYRKIEDEDTEQFIQTHKDHAKSAI